jgi:hypothetical protein
MTLLDAQRRLRELGRVRLGEKGERGPRKLTTFRLTSPNGALLDEASTRWGGEVAVWQGAPGAGVQFEVTLDADELEVFVPPQDIEGSQFYELWTGGGCARRCDGVTETITDAPCVCEEGKRECKPTTHLLVMLPQLPDMGVWRLTSHGYAAAQEIPATVALLHQFGVTLPAATLAIEQRSVDKKQFAVPVLRAPYTMSGVTVAGLPDGDDESLLTRPIAELEAETWAGGEGPVGGSDTVPTPGPGFTREEAWSSLVGTAGSIEKAGRLVNTANGTAYTRSTITEATTEEIEKAALLA